MAGLFKRRAFDARLLWHAGGDNAAFTSGDKRCGQSDSVGGSDCCSRGAQRHSTCDVYDPFAGKMLRSILMRVHENRVAALGRGAYFACADFKDSRGTVYDVDVFIKQTPNGLEATDTAIHKVDGWPRYYWVEERGQWVKRSDVSWWDRLLGRARECE